MYNPSHNDSVASKKLQGRAFHQWYSKTKNLPQVYNEIGQVKWISLVNGVPVYQYCYLNELIDVFASMPNEACIHLG